MKNDLENLNNNIGVTAGDINADEFDFNEFMESSEQDTFELARGLSASRDSAIDITIEVYKNFFADYDLPEKYTDKIYFYTVIINTALKYMQKKDKKLTLNLESGNFNDKYISSGIKYINGNDEININILDAFDKMPYDLKQVMALRNIALIDMEQISKILDISQRQASEKLYFAMQKLFEIIGSTHENIN